MYEQLTKDGYDLGSYDSFSSNLNNETKRKNLYDAITADNYDVGDYNTFSRKLDENQEGSVANQVIAEYDQSANQMTDPVARMHQLINENKKENRPSLRQKVKDMSVPSVPESPSVPSYSDMVGSEQRNYTPQIREPLKKDVAKELEEKELDVNFKAKPVAEDTDIFDNYMGRFGNTKRGIELNAELADVQSEFEQKYFDEFKRTSEYENILKGEYRTQEEADEANRKLNELFNQKYGETIKKEMAPYYAAYQEEMFDRYGYNINKEMLELNKKNTSSQINGLEKEVGRLLDEKHALLRRRGGSSGNAFNAIMGSGRYNFDSDVASQRQEIGALEASQRLLEQSQEIIEEAGKKGKTNFFGGFGRGLRDNFDWENFTLGLAEMADAKYLNNALEKAERGEALTSAEEKLLEASVANMATQTYFGSDLGRGYGAGQTTAVSLPFMLEFIANPISSSGNAIAKGLLKFGMKRFGRKAMEKGTSKFATRLLGDAVAAVGMEGTTGVPGVSAGTLERLNENYKYGFDDNGVMQVEKVGDKSFGSALAGSSASRFFENQSEMIFNAFKGWSPLMKAADNSLPGGVSEFMNRIKNSKVGTLYRELVSNPTFREIANRAQFHGLPEEYMEEVYNNLANAAIGEMSMDDVVDLDNNIDTFLGLAPTSVMFAAIGLGGMAYERLASRKRMERLFGHFTDEQKRKFEELQRMSKETGNRDIREFIKATMADESLSQEERRSEIEYAFELAKQNAIDEVQNEQPEEVQAAEAAYDEGTYMPPEQHYSAEQEKMMAGDALRNAEPGLFNVVNSILENGGKVEELKEMLTGASDEVGALALDYYYKAQRIEGVIDAGVEDAMNAGDEFERSIQDAIVTDDNGNRTITTATYRDEQVYVLADDGVHATILRDGKKEMVGSDRLSDIQQSDADVVIDEAKNQYLQQKQESLNNSINHHPKTQMPQVGMQLWSGDTPFVVTAVSPDGVVQALPSEFDSKTGQIVPKKEGMVNMSIEEAKNLQDEYYNRMDAASVQDAADAGQVADSGSTTEKILADGRRAVQTNTDGKEVSYNVLDRDGNMVDSGEMPSEEFASLRDYVPEGSENGKKEIVFSDPRTMSEEERQRRGEMLRNAVVTDVESGVITSTKEMTARKAAEKWWDENVQEPAFYDTEIGEVEINRNSVESSLAHRYGQKKLDSITSLVDGFENAVYLGTMPDSRERGVVDHYFAYPIRYDGELNYVFCRVMQDANKNRLYVHEVFVADNIKKGDTLQTAASKPHGGISIYKDILANVLETVNNNDSLHPTAQEEKPVSLGETNGPTDDGNQPALLGINSPAVSESKDSEPSAEKQEGDVNNLIPVDEKGKPLYHKAPLDATVVDLTDGNLTDEEIDIFIANYQKKAKEELEKIKGKAPKIGLDKAKYISEKKAWQAKVDEAQAKVDYWEQVQNIINESRVQSVEKPAEEVVNESMQEKEIQENANSIKGDMADEGKKSGEVTETEISAEVEERIDNEGVPAQEEAEAAEVKEDVIPSTKPVVYEQFKQDRIKEKLPEEYKSVQEWKEKSQNTYYEAVQSIYHEYQQYIESFGKGEQERVELPDKAVEKAQKVLDDIAEERKKVDESPTDAQKEAGNYKKGHVSVDSYNITIENPKGSERSGTDANGKKWSVTMNNDYGYIRGTEGVDGDHIDVFLSDFPSQGSVYVIDQMNPDTGEFDEHKVMYGFSSMDEATSAYLANYSPGWKGLGTISEVSKDEFKKWIEFSHRKTKPFADYKSVKVEAAQGENQVSATPANEDIFQMAERVVNENKEKPKGGNDILFRESDEVNRKFNEELQQQIDGSLPKGHVYLLGKPSAFLKAAGIPDLPIELASSRLSGKSLQENHPFELSEVEDLPNSIQNPLAVFRSATHIGSFVVMTEIEHKGKNFVVAIQANKKKGRIEINDIRSVHYRTTNSHMANWITEGLLEYVDKKRMAEWFSKQQYNSAEVRKQFNHATKIVESFENPSVADEKKTSDNGKVSVEEAVSLVRKFKETVPGSPEIAVISSEEDIDRLNVGEITKGELKRALNNPKVTGCYSNRAKMVFTFPSHASSVSDFEDTLSHEVAHYVSRSVELSEELKESVLEYVEEQHPDVYSKVMGYPETDRSEEAIAYLFEKKCREFGVDRVLKSKFAGDRDVANVFTEITKFLNHEKGRERNQLRGKERNRKTGNESSAGTENAVHDGRRVRGDDLFRESDTGGRGRTGTGERGEEETGSQTDFALREAATGIDANGREDVKSIEFNPATDNIIEFAERVVAFNSSRKSREEEDKEGMRFRMSESASPVSVPTIEAWDKLASSKAFLLRETAVDHLTAVEKFQDLIAERTKSDVKDYENAYQALLALSSKNREEMDRFEASIVAPLNKAIVQITGGKKKFKKWNWNEGPLRELVMYVEAKHGMERNEVMNAENETEGKDYSGLSSLFGDSTKYPDGWEKAAKDYVEQYEKSHKKEDVDGLWESIRRATGYALDKQLQSGLVGSEYVEKQLERFKYYIPLRGFADDIAEDVYGYANDGMRRGANPVKTAKGRESEAGNPFGSILEVGYSSISAGNKNLAKQRLYYFLLNHDTDGLTVVNRAWRIKPDELDKHKDLLVQYIPNPGEETPEWVEAVPNIPDNPKEGEVADIMRRFEELMGELKKKEVATEAYQKSRTNYKTLYNQRSEHQIPLMIGGNRSVITITGNPRLAQAVNGLLNPDTDEGIIAEYAKNVQRFMAGAFTSNNVAFALANLSKDTMYSNNQVFIKENGKYWLKFTKNQKLGFAELPQIMKLLHKYRNGKLDGSDEVARMFKEFMENGGATGYTFVGTQKEYSQKLEKELKKLAADRNKANPKEVLKGFFDLVEFSGQASELVNRFAAYRTSREMGRSVSRSVTDAKEITVNFNRKGAGRKTAQVGVGNMPLTVSVASALSQYGRTSMLFFNANMQAKYRMYKNLREHPVKTTVTLMGNSMAFGGVIVPFINYMIIPALLGEGGDDDDYYNSLTDYERTHNICIRLKDGYWMKIPLSPEMQPWYSIGDMIGGAVMGKREMEVSDFPKSFVDAFTPVNVNWELEGGKFLLNFVPTVSQPIAQHVTNVNFMGSPLKKEDPWGIGEYDPEYKKVFNGTSPTLVELSRLSNRMGGGDDVKASEWLLTNWNPRVIQNYISGYTGGFGTTMLGVADIITSTMNEEEGKGKGFSISQTPVLSRFLISGDKDVKLRRLNSKFHEVRDFVKEFEHDRKGYKDAMSKYYSKGDMLEYAEYKTKLEKLYDEKAYMYEDLSEISKAVNDYNKYLKENPDDERSRDMLYELMLRGVKRMEDKE